MRIEDLTVEVRDAQLTRVGRLDGADIVNALFINKFNEIGEWTIQLHATSPLADSLRTPGYGIIVTGPTGVIFSGPTMSAKLLQSDSDPDGTWTVSGATDTVILSERLAYPDPTEADVTAQGAAFDTRTGVAETVLKEYVDANLVSGPSIRQVANLTVATDQARGTSVRGSARFDTMQDLFFDLAQTGGVGYRIEQNGSGLEFEVYEPTDRTALVRFDVENGRLTSADYSYLAPMLTRAIVGGAGELDERLFYEGTLTQSTDAETVWGRRIEQFVDARSIELTAEFEQEANETLIDNGKTRVSVNVNPADNVTMLYGEDWGLGDTVEVTVGNITTTGVVYTVALSIQTDGVYLAAEVGKTNPREYEQKLTAVTSNHEKRLSEMERNTTGYGVVTTFDDVEGGTDGTQPTFDGPVFTATYTRFGDMVHFAYTVDFDNITSFGTGQYYMTLPYNARRDYVFRDGRLNDDSSGREYHITGTVQQGSNEMILWTTDRQGNRIFDFPFSYNEPVTLTTDDSFSIAGTYELEQ